MRVNANRGSSPSLACMDWIDIAQWIMVGLGALVVVGALILGALSWLLNHPRD